MGTHIMKIFGTSRHILLYKETTFELRAVRKLADALAAETAMVNNALVPKTEVDSPE